MAPSCTTRNLAETRETRPATARMAAAAEKLHQTGPQNKQGTGRPKFRSGERFAVAPSIKSREWAALAARVNQEGTAHASSANDKGRRTRRCLVSRAGVFFGRTRSG